MRPAGRGWSCRACDSSGAERLAHGRDISNTHLDVYVVPAGQPARFPNDAAGFKALIAWVAVPVRAVTYEPTGRWHRAFEEALLEAGLPLVRVNPLHARRFAQALGQRAKTDAVDARVLAQMGAAVDLRPTAASSSAQLDRHLTAIDTEIGKRLAEDEGWPGGPRS